MSHAINSWLKVNDFHEDSPELTAGKPWERLKEIAEERDARGPGSNKIAFAKRMVKHWEFSVENAAQHKNCPSVTELVAHFKERATHANQ